MQADTGTKMVHVGKNTRSRIVSKGISAGQSVNAYRGLVQARWARCARPAGAGQAAGSLRDDVVLRAERAQQAANQAGLPFGASLASARARSGQGLCARCLDAPVLQVQPTAVGARNYSQCDSMLIGDRAGANTYPYIQASARCGCRRRGLVLCQRLPTAGGFGGGRLPWP